MSDSLMGALDAPDARKWECEEGDVLIGTVVALGTFTGEYGTSRTVTVDPQEGSTESGESMELGEPILFYASATVAANELDNADPRPGDRIGIKYHGTREGKSGNDYHRYKIAVERVDQLQEKIAEEPAGSGW